MPLYAYRGATPRLEDGVFLAPDARLIGDVAVGPDASFWFGVVVRGDVNSIRIGARTNIQDGSILHVTHRLHPLTLGTDVVVGHGAILHGCEIEDGALVGVGARILDGATVETGAQVGAGAVVTPGSRISSGQLALGVPARVVRPLAEAERADIGAIAERYVALKNSYGESMGWGRRLAGKDESR